MRYIILLGLLIWAATPVNAQDSTGKRLDHKASSDAIRTTHSIKRGVGNMGRPNMKKIEYFRDTIRRERRKFDSPLFTNLSLPSTSDYAEELGKVYQMLSDIPGVMGSFVRLQDIRDYLEKGDSALDVLKEKMFQSDRNFNVRNLQRFNPQLHAFAKSPR